MKAGSDGPDSIFVQWNSVSKAVEYILETAIVENGPWTTLCRGENAFYLHDNLQDNLFHYCRAMCRPIRF